MSEATAAQDEPIEFFFDPVRLGLDAIHRFLSDGADWSLAFRGPRSSARSRTCFTLYRDLGFSALARPERGMEILRPGSYGAVASRASA